MHCSICSFFFACLCSFCNFGAYVTFHLTLQSLPTRQVLCNTYGPLVRPTQPSEIPSSWLKVDSAHTYRPVPGFLEAPICCTSDYEVFSIVFLHFLFLSLTFHKSTKSNLALIQFLSFWHCRPSFDTNPSSI